MTYSIIGRDSASGEIGAAVQSKFPGVGSIVLHGRAGAGCVTTQAFANPDHGDVGLQLMELGATAEQALSALLRSDADADRRQIALLAGSGGPVAHTGGEVLSWDGWSGSAEGAHCIASGNTLAGEQVPAAMVDAFEEAAGELSERLVQALRAGRDAGGELRGLQSAALLVVKKGGGYGGRNGRHVDISVYDHVKPIEELARCYRLHRLSYFPSDPRNLVPIDGDVARELKRIMRGARFRDFADSPDWTTQHVDALERFMGVENYDNRLRRDALVDSEVLDDLRRRYPGA